MTLFLVARLATLLIAMIAGILVAYGCPNDL
jgi:hypothetical protein